MTHPTPGENEEFAAALRAAIQQRGLSLDRIRYHLTRRGHELSVATISYWQSGRSRPERASSIAAIAALEEILGVPTGELSGKLPARRRSAPGVAGQTAAEAADAYLPYLEDLATRLGISWDSGLTQISVHDRVEIGPQHHQLSHHVKQLFVAERDGIDHYWAYYQTMGTGFIEGLHNCHLGGVEHLPEYGVLVARMTLERSLRIGESILVEHRAGHLEPQVTDRIVERAFLHAVRSAHTEVIFDESSLPLSAERFTMVDNTEKVDPIVIVGRSVHALVLDFGPGLYGVRWSW